VDRYYPRRMFLGITPDTFDVLKDNRQYRIGLQGLHPTDLRRYGLATPQGFDPLLPAPYKAFVEQYKAFQTNRLLDLQPTDIRLIDLLGVRYFLKRSSEEFATGPPSSGAYRLLSAQSPGIHVYEYINAKPSWRWIGSGTVTLMHWHPELRVFNVNAESEAGQLILIEQFYPGWRGSVDGRPISIERWNRAFQAIRVPAGPHRVTFEYRPSSVLYGAMISGLSLLGMAVWLWRVRVERPI
jgi:hypothetical protein